jgi:hypothetical protein
MRTSLGKHFGQRLTFTGTFHRYGTKPAVSTTRGTIPTALLKEVQDIGGGVLADHVWVESTPLWQNLGICPGDKVRFTARVSTYNKPEGQISYRLAALAKLEKLPKAA